jgi:hypothetical protein
VDIFNRDHPFADRAACVMLLAAFGLSDAAAVGWAAGVVNGAEVFAGALSFALIAFGAIFTAYAMEKPRTSLVRLGTPDRAL